MPKDIRWFVGACSVCTQNKWPSSVQLHPLPIPSCPWSHNALDFISGLPPSGGKSLILTVVDLFSKAVHLVPLSKRPKWSWTTSSEFMVSQRTCASVHLPYSVCRLVLPGFHLQGFTHRPTTRLSGHIRISSRYSDAWPLTTPLPEASS